MKNQSCADIITCLSTQEEAIASLYAAFAAALPQWEGFWKNLVVQEKAHGEILRQLAAFSESGDIYVNENKFNAEAIQTNVEHIKKKAAEASSEGITPIRAFSLAADIEHSLIEMNYFQVIETKCPHIKKELDAIERHTKQHIVLVEDGLKQAKSNTPVMKE